VTPFRLRYAEKAADQFALLPQAWLGEVDRQLRRLATSPVSRSKRIASPPFPPRGQLYHFTATDDDGSKWFFTVIFRYSQDETALHVLSVTWREIEDEPGI
jgi:hypothetical protein